MTIKEATCGEWLCEKVRQVSNTRFPIDLNKVLSYTVAEPMVPHVNGFSSTELQGIVGETDSALIIAANTYWWLRMTHSISYSS